MATVETTTVDEEHETLRQNLPDNSVFAEAGSPPGGSSTVAFAGAGSEPPAVSYARLSHPALLHRANGPVRSSAFKRAQQTHGNHFVQRALSQRKQGPTQFIQRECSCGGSCSSCQASSSSLANKSTEASSSSDSLVQARRNSGSTSTQSANHDLAIVGGQGEPLAEGPRNLMESGFGRDLSDVRIHKDESAATAAQALNASAYTSGRDIYFAKGEYAPESEAGKRLLAHELTHTIQQSEGKASASSAMHLNNDVVVGRADDPLEAEADAVGASVVRGERSPASLRGTRNGTGTQPIRSRTTGGTIQRFGALEHKTMGDVGAQQQPYRWDTAEEAASGQRSVNYGFELTHGDIVMLSGDLFDARETDEMGNPIPDNLFKLARTPGDKGKLLGTQDEIMYAIYKANPDDIRFMNVCPTGRQNDRSPGPTVTFPLEPDVMNPSQPFFADRVKKVVDMRYLNLAARNREHFVAPEGEESSGPKSGLFKSAGGSYRAMHETAIMFAVNAGQRGEPIDKAMAYEAAAQHYLTDAFASGHIRTPTGSIKTHWDAIYPNFWQNLKRFIAHEMAVYMNKEWNLATILGTVAAIEQDVIGTLEETIAAYPAIGFERLVADATHDVDNREGLKVVNDLGERWTAYGDSEMKAMGRGDSQKFAIEAVALGCQDIRDAYKLQVTLIDPLGEFQVDGPGGRKYRSEQKMPRVDPEFEATQLNGWQAKDIDDLWDNDIRSGSGHTYGAEFEASAKSGDISDQLKDMAALIDETKAALGDIMKLCQKGNALQECDVERNENVREPPSVEMGFALANLEPRAAFQAGVQEPLKSDTKGTLERIINFNPSAGQVWFNDDDSVMEEIDRMEVRDKKDNEASKDGRVDHNSLRGLTLNQRAKWIENIMGGTFSVVWEDEEERIAQIFETCPATDRPLLYQMIEGHEWEGDYRHGVFTWDDDLYNSLSGVELRKVRDLINEGK
jgi:hypothetical protein